jgi:hypothetical protein
MFVNYLIRCRIGDPFTPFLDKKAILDVKKYLELNNRLDSIFLILTKRRLLSPTGPRREHCREERGLLKTS